MKINCNISVFYLDKTVPKGSLLIEVGQLLKRGGYRIKVLNT
ncbi:type VI secretion protein, partial [Clostridiaceae bacterium]|nr:type VI secretion protein [Clostridiaceae bacterium]